MVSVLTSSRAESDPWITLALIADTDGAALTTTNTLTVTCKVYDLSSSVPGVDMYRGAALTPASSVHDTLQTDYGWPYPQGYNFRHIVNAADLVRPVSSFSFTGASWVHGTLTLTKVGAFAGYTWVSGDAINVTAGTSTALGWYLVASRVSDDAITLSTTLGASASAISADMHLTTGAAEGGHVFAAEYDFTFSVPSAGRRSLRHLVTVLPRSSS